MKHVVALSGGKDSTAMAIALADEEPRDYSYVITPTGNEPPAMLAHWAKLARMLETPLTVATCGKSLQGEIRRQKMLPSHRARWCTRILKLEPYYAWLERHSPCVSYVGLRADEEGRVGMTFPDADNIRMDFPMRRWRWRLEDVLRFLDKIGVEVPPRTDCQFCFWQRLGEWWLLWKDDPNAYEEAAALERFVSSERGSEYSFRSPDRDTWPASLGELRAEFERGRVPDRSLAMMDKRRLVGECRVCTL